MGPLAAAVPETSPHSVITERKLMFYFLPRKEYKCLKLVACRMTPRESDEISVYKLYSRLCCGLVSYADVESCWWLKLLRRNFEYEEADDTFLRYVGN
jgi:hypothetical protein